MTKTDDKAPKLSEWGQISKHYLEQKKEMELSYHDVEDSELEALVEEAIADASISDTSDSDDSSDAVDTNDGEIGNEHLDVDDLTEDEAASSEATDSLPIDEETAAGDMGESSETLDEPEVTEFQDHNEDLENWEELPIAPPRYSNETVIKAGLISLVALITLFLSVFSITPFGTKKDIVLTGAEHVTAEQVMSDSGIKDSDYLLTVLMNQSRYRDNLKRLNPWVKDVSISYSFPFEFTFHIKEEEVVAYGQTVDGLKPILANGLRLSTNGKTGPKGQFITVEFDNAAELEVLGKALASLKPELRQMIQFISYAPKGARSDLLLLEMTDGNLVCVPLAHLAEKLPYYERIASKVTESSIIDMEVGIYITTQMVENTKVLPEDSSDSAITDALSTEATAETTEELVQ